MRLLVVILLLLCCARGEKPYTARPGVEKGSVLMCRYCSAWLATANVDVTEITKMNDSTFTAVWDWEIPYICPKCKNYTYYFTDYWFWRSND